MAKGLTARRQRGTKAGAAMAKEEKTSTRTSPGEFVRQVRAETSKVVWPTREETVRTAIFVGILVVLLSLFFLGVDSAFGALVRWLLSLV
jgi:preprotein translocase subunit SecE